MAVKLGPGELKIGETGTEVDVSCLVNGMKITNEKDQADSTTKLCGTVVAGSTTYTYTLEGNVDIDPAEVSGLFRLCQSDPGGEYPFTFTPNTADGTAAAGRLIVDPLDFGADEYGADMTSDISFSIIGAPTFTYAAPPPLADAAAAAAEDVLVGA